MGGAQEVRGEQYEMETEGQMGVGHGNVWQGVWILFSGQLEPGPIG